MAKKTKSTPPEAEVTERNTKADILAAYQRLAQAAAAKSAKPQDALFFAEENRPAMKPETRKEVEELSLDAIVMELSSLRLSIGKHLAELEQHLTGEAAKLKVLKDAVAEQEARLGELHDIEAAAGKLEELRLTMAGEQASFETAVAETRIRWDKDKKEHEIALKERDALEKKERAREEEDYQYQRKQRRQREKDAFEAEREERRRKLEEELASREADANAREEILATREQELADLHRRVEVFPSQLEEEVRAASKSGVKATEERFKLERLLLEKDMEREREVMRLTVTGLQEKVKEQITRIKALESDLKESATRSQSVAARAIEGIAGLHHTAATPAEVVKEPQANREG